MKKPQVLAYTAVVIAMIALLTLPAAVGAAGDDGADSPEPTAEEELSTDDSEPEPAPTLEKDAPPRPGATMARSHKTHNRPLILSNHPAVNPETTHIPGESRPDVVPATAASRDGLIVSGVGVLLPRTPEDVSLTRDSVETANLDWLLDVAMRHSGRHPRVAFEGETFTITVTVEARNTTLTGDDPAYVVLVPPPCETGVYEIARTGEPKKLSDGERAVWEFSVFTRIGRLALEDLTLIEERRITNLTATPEFFSFRAFALAGDQEHPTMGFSDPVISVRPAGIAGETSTLPALYALAGTKDSPLLPSETIPDAWMRNINHDQITAGAVGHLDALANPGRGELAALYAEEGMAGVDAPTATPSLFDAVTAFFGDLIRLIAGGP